MHRGELVGGSSDGLLPLAHRRDPHLHFVLLRSDAVPAEQALLEAADAVAQRLPNERILLAPPAREIDAWMDASALFLLPAQADPRLADKLKPHAIAAAISVLRARLSSPLFGTTGEDPRRDPIGLRELVRGLSHSIGHVDPHDKMFAPRVTVAGDLVSFDGQAALLLLQSERSLDALETELREAVGDEIHVDVLGEGTRERAARTLVRNAGVHVLVSTLALLAIVLAVEARSIRPVVSMLACALAPALLLVSLLPGIDTLSIPILAISFGIAVARTFICEHQPPAWSSELLLATALLPLAFTEYPAWAHLAWCWALAWLFGSMVVRVMWSDRSLSRASKPWFGRSRVSLVPMRWLAITMTIIVLVAAAWASTHLRYAGPSVTPFHETLAEAEQTLARSFFNQDTLAEARSVATTEEEALDLAAEDARLIAALVPTQVALLDAPGSFVLPSSQVGSRHQALLELRLADAMEVVRSNLVSQGLRVDAFAEFLASTADLSHPPTASAALQGPLAAWIDRYIDRGQTSVSVRSYLHLRHDAAVPDVRGADQAALPLRGPIVFALEDRERFPTWLATLIVLGFSVAGTCAWAHARNLATALATAMGGFVAQAALWLVLDLAGRSIGPHLLPIFLLTGTIAAVLGMRACLASTQVEALAPGAWLVAGLALLAPGGASIVAIEPLWRELGLAWLLGASLATGAGLFIAPGLCAAMRSWSSARAG